MLWSKSLSIFLRWIRPKNRTFQIAIHQPEFVIDSIVNDPRIESESPILRANNAIHVPQKQRMGIYLQREYSLDSFRLPISSSVDFQSAATWRSEVDILFILVGRWPRLTRDFHRSTGTRLIKSEMGFPAVRPACYLLAVDSRVKL